MLWAIGVTLGLMWLLGTIALYTMGGLIHILLVIAIIMFLANFIISRQPL